MVEIVLEEVPVGRLGVEREGILAFVGQLGIVAPQMPVATFNGTGFFGLAATHASLDLKTVVDTGCIGNDE